MANLTGLAQGINYGLERGREKRIEDEEIRRKRAAEDVAAERAGIRWQEELDNRNLRDRKGKAAVEGLEDSVEQNRDRFNYEKEELRPHDSKMRELKEESAEFGLGEARYDAGRKRTDDRFQDEMRPIEKEGAEIGLENARYESKRRPIEDAQKDQEREIAISAGYEDRDYQKEQRDLQSIGQNRQRDLTAGKDFLRYIGAGQIDKAVEVHNATASDDNDIIPGSVKFDPQTGRLSFKEKDGDEFNGTIQQFQHAVTTMEEKLAAAKKDSGGKGKGRGVSPYNPQTSLSKANQEFATVLGGKFENGFWTPPKGTEGIYNSMVQWYGEAERELREQIIAGDGVSENEIIAAVTDISRGLRKDEQLNTEYSNDIEKINTAKAADIIQARRALSEFIQKAKSGGLGSEIPPKAQQQIDTKMAEGKREVRFFNGQVWTKQNGQYVRVQ